MDKKNLNYDNSINLNYDNSIYDNSKLRSRILQIRKALTSETDEVIIRRLRNGEYQEPIEELSTDNSPLTFTELCTFNTWFILHPHKQAGETTFATSRDFPIKIKGNKDTILTTLERGIKEVQKGASSSTQKNTNLSLLRLKAKALQIQLQIELEIKSH